MLRICMITTSDIDYDSRILNEAQTLSQKFEVKILSRKYQHKNIVAEKSYKISRVDFRRFRSFKFNIFSSLLSLAKAAFKENPDVYHAHDLDGLLCAFGAALFKRKTLIYDSHELWSDIYPFGNLKGIQWLLPILEKILMIKVTCGITVNSSISRILSQKYHKEFIALYNVMNTPIVKSRTKLKKKYPNKKIILHLGAADEGRGMEQIIESAKYLPKNYLVIFLGGGKTESELKEKIREENLGERIKLLPPIPPEEIISTIKNVDLGLALTQKISLSYYYSSPNKLFQYIAAEVPILGSNFPEYKKIILQNSIGEVVDPSKPKLIAQKIIKMLDTKKQNKYRKNLEDLAKAKYNWTIESKKLIRFYEDLECHKN